MSKRAAEITLDAPAEDGSGPSRLTLGEFPAPPATPALDAAEEVADTTRTNRRAPSAHSAAGAYSSRAARPSVFSRGRSRPGAPLPSTAPALQLCPRSHAFRGAPPKPCNF